MPNMTPRFSPDPMVMVNDLAVLARPNTLLLFRLTTPAPGNGPAELPSETGGFAGFVAVKVYPFPLASAKMLA